MSMDIVSRLRCVLKGDKTAQAGADEIERLRAEIERLNAGRHELQAAGTHPAPCARHCESTAYEIEIRRLRAELAHYTEAATKLSAETYDLEAELTASREREARMRDAVRGLLDALPSATTHPAIKAARAALAEGAQG